MTDLPDLPPEKKDDGEEYDEKREDGGFFSHSLGTCCFQLIVEKSTGQYRKCGDFDVVVEEKGGCLPQDRMFLKGIG